MRKLVALLIVMLGLMGVAHAQGSAIVGQVIQPAPPTGTGGPAPFATVRVCAISGTGLPCSPTSSIFADAALSQPVANPYTTDQYGNYSVFVAAGYYLVQVGATANVTYSYLYSANGNASVSSVGLALPGSVFVVTGSPVTGAGTLIGSFISQTQNTFLGAPNGSGGVPSFRALATADIPWATPGTIGSTTPNTGKFTDLIAKTQNGNSYVYADQYANVQAAITACGTNGCIVDARSVNTNLTMGAIDPGTKSVFLLLGPFTYTFTQITLQSSFQIWGSAPEVGITNQPGTILQSVGNDATPAMVLGTQPVSGVGIYNLRIYGADLSNTGTQPGLKFQASNGGGLWYSILSNVYIANFGGIVVDFDGSQSGGLNQFDTFYDVKVFRNTYDGVHANYALRILGAAGQLTFNTSQFDGQFNTKDAGENVRIEASNVTGFLLPYSISFNQMTNQFAAIGTHIIGAVGVKFNEPHIEDETGCFLIDYSGGSGVGSWGIIVEAGRFQNSSGTVAGGYLAKITPAAGTNSSLQFLRNGAFQTPDTAVIGQADGNVIVEGNYPMTPGVTLNNTGLEPTIAPATSIATNLARMVNLSNSATPIANIVSSVPPGSSITLQVLSGSAIFNNSGNLTLGGYTTLTVYAGESVTFVGSNTGQNWQLSGFGKSNLPYMNFDSATPTACSGCVAFGSTTGFGGGSSGTAVTTTTKGGGTGPTTPQTVVNYIKINLSGTDYWIPLVQ